MEGEKLDYWAFFAREAEKLGSPLYARIASGVAGDAELRALAAGVRAGQPPANVLLAAVHFLLLQGASGPLRDFYPNLNGGRAKEGDPFPPFQDFCAANRAALETLIATRVTNTNEVGRSAILHPGFREVAREAGEPLRLVEIGPSAGLNLVWDQYGVRYLRNGETVASLAPDAGLVIDCELRGAGLPPVGPTPRVESRLGLEMSPVDLENADERDWLRALMWPDQIARGERLDRAIALARGARPEIRAGDALALLPDVLRGGDGPVCVYHTVAVYQFSAEMRARLDEILAEASQRRAVWRLSFEGGWDGIYTLSFMRYAKSGKTERELAHAHPHGAWIEWLSAPDAEGIAAFVAGG
jgi:hypothetical protein